MTTCAHAYGPWFAAHDAKDTEQRRCVKCGASWLVRPAAAADKRQK